MRAVCAYLLLTLLVSAVLFSHSALILAAEPDAKSDEIPPALTEYMGRTIAPTMSYQGAAWLVRESRAREEDSDTLLEALKIKPGQTVCDVGCGNGYYTLKMAELVGEKGKVLAVDIQSEMLELLSVRLREDDIDHVEPIQGTLIDPKLPEGQVDMALLVDVYHEFSHPVHMLAALRKSLKPKGQLVLVEFRGEDPLVPIRPLHKMTKEQILKEIPANGFKLVREFEDLPWQHVMFFEPAPVPEDAADEKDEGGE